MAQCKGLLEILANQSPVCLLIDGLALHPRGHSPHKKWANRQIRNYGEGEEIMNSQEAVDDIVAKLLRPLVDQDLSVAFYDMTTIRAEGLATWRAIR